LSILPKAFATILLTAATASNFAQTPPAPTKPAPPPPSIPFNRGIIFIDPAHGGIDSGSRITDSIVEKDVTLSLAFKLRALLAARGFSVVMSRDSDAATEPNSPTPLTLDDRAGIANHAHPVACIVIHATAAGDGVHLYSSELDSTPTQPLDLPWLTAQAPWVTQSILLEKSIGQAITRSGIPLIMGRASVRPVDSLTCPAVIVELAPATDDDASVNDGSYQQHVAEDIANSLILWKSQAQPPPPAHKGDTP
jgi:N-acetylmuramoyl-L-alanine amidase